MGPLPPSPKGSPDIHQPSPSKLATLRRKGLKYAPKPPSAIAATTTRNHHQLSITDPYHLLLYRHHRASRSRLRSDPSSLPSSHRHRHPHPPRPSKFKSQSKFKSTTAPRNGKRDLAFSVQQQHYREQQRRHRESRTPRRAHLDGGSDAEQWKAKLSILRETFPGLKRDDLRLVLVNCKGDRNRAVHAVLEGIFASAGYESKKPTIFVAGTSPFSPQTTSQADSPSSSTTLPSSSSASPRRAKEEGTTTREKNKGGQEVGAAGKKETQPELVVPKGQDGATTRGDKGSRRKLGAAGKKEPKPELVREGSSGLNESHPCALPGHPGALLGECARGMHPQSPQGRAAVRRIARAQVLRARKAETSTDKGTGAGTGAGTGTGVSTETRVSIATRAVQPRVPSPTPPKSLPVATTMTTTAVRATTMTITTPTATLTTSYARSTETLKAAPKTVTAPAHINAIEKPIPNVDASTGGKKVPTGPRMSKAAAALNAAPKRGRNIVPVLPSTPPTAPCGPRGRGRIQAPVEVQVQAKSQIPARRPRSPKTRVMWTV